MKSWPRPSKPSSTLAASLLTPSPWKARSICTAHLLTVRPARCQIEPLPFHNPVLPSSPSETAVFGYRDVGETRNGSKHLPNPKSPNFSHFLLISNYCTWTLQPFQVSSHRPFILDESYTTPESAAFYKEGYEGALLARTDFPMKLLSWAAYGKPANLQSHG
jgi:hypothetical protein